MLRHPVKKIFGLTILYSFIIIGIFVLQFKNESVISRNIGLLRISVAQSQDSQGNSQLKNTLQVSFKGISFTADDVTPAVLTLADNQTKNLTLTGWNQSSPFAFTFQFDNDTEITFSVTDTSQKAGLFVSSRLPEGARSLSLTYKTESGFAVTEQTKNRQLVSSKNAIYVMNAPEINQDMFSFTSANTTASYSIYEPETRFTFRSVSADTPLSTAEAYENTLKHLNNSIMSISSATMQDSAIFTENTAVAYIAEMAAHNRYQEALEKIPESLRRGSRRTYFSAPFFDSLVAMNQSLTMVSNNMAEMVKNALVQKNLDIFTVSSIADYMLREESNGTILNLAVMISTLPEFNPTLSQATGIISVYLALAKKKSFLAGKMEYALPTCLMTIENHCTMSDNMIHLAEKDMTVSLLQALDTGKTLMDYGTYFSAPEYEICGRLIINSAFSQANEHDIRTLAEAYPILRGDNRFYPHYQIVGRTGNKKIWAWTCAQDITYTESADHSEATITITFPQNDTHYIILKEIKPFTGINIYGIAFHTDPRFESYNSSGYVYNEQTRTLFLKSRHKDNREVIKLFFSRPVSARPAAAETSAPAEQKPAAPAQSPQPPAQSPQPPAQENTDSQKAVDE